MSLRTEDKLARAEAARLRMTRCRFHRCVDCGNQNCRRLLRRSLRSGPRKSTHHQAAQPDQSVQETQEREFTPRSWLPLLDEPAPPPIDGDVYSASQRAMTLRELIAQKQASAAVDCGTF